jgi:hypothetical protein
MHKSLIKKEHSHFKHFPFFSTVQDESMDNAVPKFILSTPINGRKLYAPLFDAFKAMMNMEIGNL